MTGRYAGGTGFQLGAFFSIHAAVGGEPEGIRNAPKGRSSKSLVFSPN
jgi:hypothetical protein